MLKIVRYTGPRRGGITQIGSTPVQVPWDTPVELPDRLADAMLAQYPDEWSEVPKPAKKAAAKKAAKPAAAKKAAKPAAAKKAAKPAAAKKAAERPPVTSPADESPEGEEVHLS